MRISPGALNDFFVAYASATGCAPKLIEALDRELNGIALGDPVVDPSADIKRLAVVVERVARVFHLAKQQRLGGLKCSAGVADAYLH